MKSIKKVRAACAVYKYPELEEIEVAIYTESPKKTFPYVPGYLSFREIPFLLKAIEKLKSPVDLFMVDGQGRAHPRGMGLAVHLGLLLKKPTIGSAKKRLYGAETEVAAKKGSVSYLRDKKGDIIGAKLRTRDNVKPVYVSQGWGVSLERAVEIVLNSCPKYRLPEMIRAAHNNAQINGGKINS